MQGNVRVGVHEARKHDFAPSGGETRLGRVLLRRYTSVIRPVVLSTVIEVSATKPFFLGSKRREVCIVNADIGRRTMLAWREWGKERGSWKSMFINRTNPEQQVTHLCVSVQTDIACWRNNNQSPYYKRVSRRKGTVNRTVSFWSPNCTIASGFEC